MEIGIYIVIILLTFFFQLMKKAFKNKNNANFVQKNGQTTTTADSATQERAGSSASVLQNPSQVRLSFEDEGEYEGEPGYDDGYEVERKRQRMRAQERESRREQELGHNIVKENKSTDKGTSWAEVLREKANQQMQKSPRGKSFVKDLLSDIDIFYEDAQSANVQPAAQFQPQQRQSAQQADGKNNQAQAFLSTDAQTTKANRFAFSQDFEPDAEVNKAQTEKQANRYEVEKRIKGGNSRQTKKALLQMLKGSQASKREAILLGELLGPALAMRKTPGGQSIQN